MYFSANEIKIINGINLRPHKQWLSYLEAEEMVRKWDVKTRAEYLKLPLEKRQAIGLPSNPEKRYKGNGWKGWDEFLGKNKS
jgi:hypothetical protein